MSISKSKIPDGVDGRGAVGTGRACKGVSMRLILRLASARFMFHLLARRRRVHEWACYSKCRHRGERRVRKNKREKGEEKERREG
jgi:hypothetical protein